MAAAVLPRPGGTTGKKGRAMYCKEERYSAVLSRYFERYYRCHKGLGGTTGSPGGTTAETVIPEKQLKLKQQYLEHPNSEWDETNFVGKIATCSFQQNIEDQQGRKYGVDKGVKPPCTKNR